MAEKMFVKKPKLFNQDLLSQWPILNRGAKQLLLTHEKLFPKSFAHSQVAYSASMNQLIRKRNRLLKDLPKKRAYMTEAHKDRSLLQIHAKLSSALLSRGKTLAPTTLEKAIKPLKQRSGQTPNDLTGAYRQLAHLYLSKANPRQESDFHWLLVGLTFAKGRKVEKDLGRFIQALKLQESDLDYLKDAAIWRPVLKGVLEFLPPSYKASFRREAQNCLKKALVHFSASARSKPVVLRKGHRLSLIEVHPDLAVMRGYVANDCATASSFAFPYSPYERTFYIQNGRKQVLGYASLSLVKVEGKASLYLHTITGPSLLQSQADFCISMIERAKEKIGGTRVYLPEDHRIDENVNYQAAREAMKARVDQTAPQLLSWSDSTLRKLISKHGNTLFYDGTHKNKLGRLVTAGPAFDLVFAETSFQSPCDFAKVRVH